MSEKSIQEKILKKLNSIPGTSFDKKQASPYGNKNGFSDLVGVIYGRAVYIEVKENSLPTALQIEFLRKKKACGALVGFAQSVDDAVGICHGFFGVEYPKLGWSRNA
jgi:hypothetical protein